MLGRKTYGTPAPEQKAAPVPAPAPTPKKENGKMEFKRITGLFQSAKKEGSYSAFISPEMAEVLRTIKGGTKADPGDMIGVSTDKETGQIYLWVGKR